MPDSRLLTPLSRRGRVDLLILFPIGYDVVRNVDLYRQQQDSKLDQFLGPDSGWHECGRSYKIAPRSESDTRVCRQSTRDNLPAIWVQEVWGGDD